MDGKLQLGDLGKGFFYMRNKILRNFKLYKS